VRLDQFARVPFEHSAPSGESWARFGALFES